MIQKMKINRMVLRNMMNTMKKINTREKYIENKRMNQKIMKYKISPDYTTMKIKRNANKCPNKLLK